MPRSSDYRRLREITGLSPKSAAAAARGLPNTLFAVVVERDGQVVGMGRLVGDGVRDWYGTSIVGQSMRDLIPPEAHEQRAPLLRHCLAEGAPAWFSGPMLVNKQPVRSAGRLLLPVSFKGGTPDGVVMVVFIEESGAVRPSIALDEARTCPRAELG